LEFLARITEPAIGIFIEIEEVAFPVCNEDAIRRLFEEHPVEPPILQVILYSWRRFFHSSHLFFNLYS